MIEDIAEHEADVYRTDHHTAYFYRCQAPNEDVMHVVGTRGSMVVSVADVAELAALALMMGGLGARAEIEAAMDRVERAAADRG